jgi:hypothetical protein
MSITGQFCPHSRGTQECLRLRYFDSCCAGGRAEIGSIAEAKRPIARRWRSGVSCRPSATSAEKSHRKVGSAATVAFAQRRATLREDQVGPS